jgi:hypothetical protein
MQGIEVFLAPHRGIGGFGSLQCFVREHADNGIDPRVHRRQPIEQAPTAARLETSPLRITCARSTAVHFQSSTNEASLASKERAIDI